MNLDDVPHRTAAPRWATLRELVTDAASRYGDREFLRCPDRTLSFRAADAYGADLARKLAGHGVRPGDRVAILLGNSADWPLSWLGVVKAGAVAVPVDARCGAFDLRHVLHDSRAALVLTAPGLAALAHRAAGGLGRPCAVRTLPGLDADGRRGDLPRLSARTDATVGLQYTAGTTGFPKACVLSHDYWLRTAWGIGAGAGLRRADVVLTTQSFAYAGPQWQTVMCLMAGVPLVVLERFSAAGFWDSVRRHGATVTHVVGGMPTLLYKQPPRPADRDHALRLVLCSGIRPERHREYEERWGAAWRELYGSTESGLDLISPVGEESAVGSGALGRAPAGKRVVVADERGERVPPGAAGEILVRGRPMMKGYWNGAEATAQVFRGGWYHTGDLGVADPAGRVRHAGRLTEVIRRGGEQIAPAEVEAVLEAHPAVLAAAVVGIPDQLSGELPKAFVRLRPGTPPTAPTARSLLAHARRRLARPEVPAYLEFVGSFPTTASARVRKHLLLRPGDDQRGGAFSAAADGWV
ncbi:AMP-binding protein [Streptomyces sp. NPDC023723]|uniref:class I adenylate-forming enzyme family protein n=1 Tax=Streptomyces sp. NPDC023723 TaxID=3154323 RepID=UPI0033F14F37